MYLHRRRIVLCAALAVVGLADAAHAADECEVQYGYNTGLGLDRKDHVTTIHLNAGQIKRIDRRRMNFVRNLKSHKVKVTLNDRLLTLSQDDVHPPAFFYTSDTILESLECLTSVSEPRLGSP